MELLKKMKKCELCKAIARVYCDSDSAWLCWSCDAKVHSANFLVARHSRSLLCRICQSPTPWSASGEQLCPSTASFCGRCAVESISDDREERVGGNDGDNEYVEDNNGVPWSSMPPPTVASSSSSEEFPVADRGVLLKRKSRNVADLISENQDDPDCSTVNINHNTQLSPMPEPASEDEMTSIHLTLSSSKATAGKLKRFRHRNIISGNYMSAPVRDTCKSIRTAGFDLNLSP